MTKTPQKPKVLTADVVEAGMFVLVDEQGKRRAKLSCMSDEHCKDGYVTAQLLDGAGKPRITLQVNDEGASIQLWNRSNSPCITLNVADERGTGVVVCDLDGKGRFQVGSARNDTSDKLDVRMEIINSDGKVTLSEPG